MLHGLWVETRKNWFVEGAWAGEFTDGDFHRSHTMMGSGARLENAELIISSPTHFHDSLYSIRVSSELLISNSKVFVLAQAGDDLNPQYPYYFRDCATFRSQGLRRTPRVLPTRDGRQLRQSTFVNIRIDRELHVGIEEKPIAPESGSFEEYRDLLGETTHAIVENAQDPRRNHSYRLSAMISRGYDSPASAVLAAECGCEEAITFAKLDPDDTYLEDGGAEIAAHLGMKCSKYSRTAFKRLPGIPDAEFCACPNGGHVQMAAIEDQLAGTFLFQGHNGDLAWGIERSIHYPDLRTHERRVWITLAASSDSEFRLRVGFINYSVAYVGAHHHQRLRAIGLSDAMKPWSVGGEYDRPIPRRIVEEAGVPRELFGQEKITGLNHLFPRYGLTRAGERDFDRFYSSIRTPHSGVHGVAFHFMCRLHRWCSKCVRALNRLGDSFNWTTVFTSPISMRYHGPISKYDFTMQWGVRRILDRYQMNDRVDSRDSETDCESAETGRR